MEVSRAVSLQLSGRRGSQPTPSLTSLPRGRAPPCSEADPVWQEPESQSETLDSQQWLEISPQAALLKAESLLTDRASRGGWLTRWICRAPCGSLQVLTGTETVDEMTHPPTFHTTSIPSVHADTHTHHTTSLYQPCHPHRP